MKSHPQAWVERRVNRVDGDLLVVDAHDHACLSLVSPCDHFHVVSSDEVLDELHEWDLECVDSYV